MRTGLFRYIRHHRLPEYEARGWLILNMLADCHHGDWSALCWHCECDEVTP